MAYQTAGSILRLHHPFSFMSVSYAPLRPQRSGSLLRRKGIMGSTCKSRLELPGAVIETWETDDDSEQIFKFARFFSADGRHIPLPLRKATGYSVRRKPRIHCQVLGRGRTNKVGASTGPSFPSPIIPGDVCFHRQKIEPRSCAPSGTGTNLNHLHVMIDVPKINDETEA